MLPLAITATVVFVAGQVLRYSAILALGSRWSVKVMTVPNEPPVTTGIYRWLRHPNYLGVVLEIASLPLLHSGFLTAVVFSAWNGYVLGRRVHAEEKALTAAGGYREAFGGR
jgi:methyltransferase